jgi:hypothetical protein
VKRQAPISHPSKSNALVQEAGGIVGREERQEWARLRRNCEPISENSRGSIIAGIDIDVEDRWRTNAQRQNNFEGTSRSQLVLNKRLGAKGSGVGAAGPEKDSIDQYNLSSKATDHDRMARLRQEKENAWRSSSQDSLPQQESLVGFRAPARVASGSLLSNIGTSILKQLPEDVEQPHTKPYLPSKDLLAQNFNPAPGYCGSRSRRSVL